MSRARIFTRARVVWAAVIAALLAFGLSAVPGTASTPSSGTLSSTSAVVTWGGGPFTVPNLTGTATGAPDCSAPQSCDDFTLKVSTTAAYGSTHVLKIDVSWPTAAADFDLYVLDAAGNEVATSASSADPEEVVLPPTSGTYTVRVVPYAPLGESYQAKATLLKKPADPAPGTTTPPKFKTYGAPATLPDAHNAGEPSIGNNFRTGATLYQSYLSTYKVTFDDTVSPPAATWSDASANATNGCVVGSTESLDPILFTDHETGRTFESQLSGVDSLTCYTDDDGKTWLPSQGGGIPSGVDHQTIGGGRFSSNGVGALPTSTYKNAVYYCSQDIATAFCAVSRDGGTTFGAGVPTYSLLDCGGLHGHVKVAPDGTAYLPNKGCGSNAAVVVSGDNGTSWTVRKVPGSTPSDADPSVGVGKNGTVYFGYVGSDGRPAVAVSRNKGATWSNNQPVGTEFGINNAVFPTVVAGDDDRAAIAYIGTPTDGNYQDTANFKGIWHLYISTTYDGGKTWQTSDATPNDPVQRGSICTGGTTCGDDRNLLDFIGVTTDKQGRIEVGFADGCTGPCVSDPARNNHDAYATIARQRTGKTLLAAFDPKPNLTVPAMTVTRASGAFTDKVTMANAGNAKASNANLGVYDNGRLVGSVTGITLAPGASRVYSITWKATAGKHSVTAIADPGDLIAESNEGDNKRTATAP